MILKIIFGFVCVFVGLLLIIIGDSDEARNREWMVPIGTLVLFFWGMLMSFGVYDLAEKRTYIDALNGNNPYSKEYIYKQQDSTYVVVDSIYIKKETKN